MGQSSSPQSTISIIRHPVYINVIFFSPLAVKGNRTLVWKPHLGSANIDIEIGDKKINLNVPPMQAAIIYQFQIKEEWSADQLSHEIKVPASTIRRYFCLQLFVYIICLQLFVYIICIHNLFTLFVYIF